MWPFYLISEQLPFSSRNLSFCLFCTLSTASPTNQGRATQPQYSVPVVWPITTNLCKVFEAHLKSAASEKRASFHRQTHRWTNCIQKYQKGHIMVRWSEKLNFWARPWSHGLFGYKVLFYKSTFTSGAKMGSVFVFLHKESSLERCDWVYWSK